MPTASLAVPDAQKCLAEAHVRFVGSFSSLTGSGIWVRFRS